MHDQKTDIQEIAAKHVCSWSIQTHSVVQKPILNLGHFDSHLYLSNSLSNEGLNLSLILCSSTISGDSQFKFEKLS